jgi:hypothetical protein
MAADTKVVSASNENRVLFHGTEDDARDFVEQNFPRHHVDPAAPTMEEPEPDVYLVGKSGKEMYLGPEHEDGWVKVGGGKATTTAGGKP